MTTGTSGVGSSDNARNSSYTSWGGDDSSSDNTTDTSAHSLTTADIFAASDTTEDRLSQREAPAQAIENGSESETEIAAAVAGIAGAGGREGSVQAVLDRSYQAGLNAPQESYHGEVHRGNPTDYENATLGYEHSRSGRYHAEGQHAVYGAPTQAGAVRELSIYAPDPGSPNRTYTQLDVSIRPDPVTGTGGVADIRAGLRQQNLPVSALTQPSRGSIATSLGHVLTGEQQYSAPQQVGKGAIDAGAAAIRAPAAVGGTQIDFLPANMDPASISPVNRQTMTPDGNIGPVRNATAVAPMPAYSSPVTPGAIDMPAGAAGRASSMRYGAAGGAFDTVIHAGIDIARGNSVNAQDVAVATGANALVGGGAARAVDALTPRLGMVKAGGAVGGAIQATVSGYSNYNAYNEGRVSGEQAIANTLVDTGTAVAAGATGAAAGALVGSVVPVAGTAVGAVAGFAVGVGAHYAIQAVDSVTGFTDSAKSAIAGGLESAGSWVKSWW